MTPIQHNGQWFLPCEAGEAELAKVGQVWFTYNSKRGTWHWPNEDHWLFHDDFEKLNPTFFKLLPMPGEGEWEVFYGRDAGERVKPREYWYLPPNRSVGESWVHQPSGAMRTWDAAVLYALPKIPAPAVEPEVPEEVLREEKIKRRRESLEYMKRLSESHNQAEKEAWDRTKASVFDWPDDAAEVLPLLASVTYGDKIQVKIRKHEETGQTAEVAETPQPEVPDGYRLATSADGKPKKGWKVIGRAYKYWAEVVDDYQGDQLFDCKYALPVTPQVPGWACDACYVQNGADRDKCWKCEASRICFPKELPTYRDLTPEELQCLPAGVEWRVRYSEHAWQPIEGVGVPAWTIIGPWMDCEFRVSLGVPPVKDVTANAFSRDRPEGDVTLPQGVVRGFVVSSCFSGEDGDYERSYRVDCQKRVNGDIPGGAAVFIVPDNGEHVVVRKGYEVEVELCADNVIIFEEISPFEKGEKVLVRRKP